MDVMFGEASQCNDAQGHFIYSLIQQSAHSMVFVYTDTRQTRHVLDWDQTVESINHRQNINVEVYAIQPTTLSSEARQDTEAAHSDDSDEDESVLW